MLELAAQVAFPLLTRLPAGFPLGFHPWLHQNLPDHVPMLCDSKALPSFWSLYPGQSWALILEMGIWMLSAKPSALGTAQLCR